MRMHSLRRAAAVVLTALLLTTTVVAQWINYPTAGVPRLPDGRPDLDPRRRRGRPTASRIVRHLVRGGPRTLQRRAGPEAEGNSALGGNPPHSAGPGSRMDSPLSSACRSTCRIHNFLGLTGSSRRRRWSWCPTNQPTSRPGLSLPTAAICQVSNPTWLGYSVGRWEGDTLVVATAGFNDQGWLDSAGHPQTETLRVTERFRRRDFGHMEHEMTLADPKAFTQAGDAETERLL